MIIYIDDIDIEIIDWHGLENKIYRSSVPQWRVGGVSDSHSLHGLAWYFEGL